MAGILLNRSRQVPAEETPAFGGIAERFRRAGDLDRAIALCRDGLKRFPDQLSARVTLGWSLLDKGQYDEARAELEKVLRKAPDNLAAIRGLAELHDRSEGAMPAMDDRESWRQEESDTAAELTRATVPAAEPVVARSAPPAAPETPVDPFAPIAVTLGSSTAAEPPKLLHTAEHAGLAAQEAAASADAQSEPDQAVVPVQLEDPATASMAAAELPTPFFASSSERDTEALAVEPAPAASASDLTIDLEASVPTIDFGMAESSGADLVFNSGDDATLSLDWDAPAPSVRAEAYVGLDEPAEVDASAADELEDAIKALRDDTAIVLADLPVPDAIVEVESPGDPVVAFDTAVEPEFALDEALAALQIEEEPAPVSQDATVAALQEAPEPIASLDLVETVDSSIDLRTTELEPPTFDAGDLDAEALFEVQAEELPDAVPALLEEDRAPVGLIELPANEGGHEALPDDVDEADLVTASAMVAVEAVEDEATTGPVFELVAPEPALFAAEESVAESDVLATGESEGGLDLTPDLFSLVSDEEVALEAELSTMVEALAAGVAETPAAVVEPELEPEPALAAVSALAPVEIEQAPEPVQVHVDEVVQESVAALFSSHSPALTDVVVNIESRRPEPKPAVVALERLLRKVEARRLQLLTETVA